MLPLETPINSIKGIAPRFLPKLAKLGIHTAGDLIHHLPARYEDFSAIKPIAALTAGESATVQGTVTAVRNRRSWRRNLHLMEADLMDDSGSIRATWFNQPYLAKNLPPGTPARFAGRVSVSKKTGELFLASPAYEIVREGGIATHTGRIVPLYPETRGITSKGIRFLIAKLFALEPDILDPLPETIRMREKLLPLVDAFHAIHFPERAADTLRARRRFAFDDILLLQLKNLRERRRLSELRAPRVSPDVERIKRLIAELPFELTLSQKRSLWEIVQDLAEPRPMNRILQGDVGSGKTAVAAIAALRAADEDVQTALMAPTELLARQHYRTIEKLFPHFEGGVALVTASETRIRYGSGMEGKVSRTDAAREIKKGTVAIAIGTHALIAVRGKNPVSFKNLGLIIVDEQHRFGVRQRGALALHRSGASVPHFLSMSATPIPRTLALTVFGDLDLSTITELPKNRIGILTKVIPPDGRADAYAFIREQIAGGRQAFVICPRIDPKPNELPTMEEMGRLDQKAVKDEYEKLSKRIFPDLNVAMLHGKMRADEKDSTMEKFRSGAIDILVSTSVVEVGVDVPNASVMVIEGADRFGLAQLYQFRGRVGRGEHASHCFLFSESSSPDAAQRLRAVATAKNGFELAEVDLRLRGPGEFFGESQTGMPDIAMEAIRNPELVQAAREAANEIARHDPTLAKNPILRARLGRFADEVHHE